MTDQIIPTDVSTLDARRLSAQIELSDDGTTYTATRVFGAAPERTFQAFTDPADIRVWFTAGAPPGSELTVCESDPVAGGKYHYEMVMPEWGTAAWHGNYTGVARPDQLTADEWFVFGDEGPDGPPSTQTMTFEGIGDGLTFVTMTVVMPAPEDPEVFMEQSAAGLAASLTALDELVSS